MSSPKHSHSSEEGAPKPFGGKKALRQTFLAPFQTALGRAWWVFVKELQSFLASNFPPLSMGIIIFLCGMLSVLPHKTENTYEDTARTIFHMFYVLILMAGVLFSMSAFVSERRQGTLELLYTLPVKDTQLVIGKFLMGIFLCGCLAAIMSLFYVFWMAEAPWYITLSGCLGLFAAGLYACSVGIFASSLTNSYLLSLLIACLIIGMIDIGGYFAGLLPSPAKEILSHIHGLNQFFAFTKGIIPLRPLVFFGSLSGLFLFLSVKVLESRRWRGRAN